MLSQNMFATKDAESDATLSDIEREFSQNVKITNKIKIIIKNVDVNDTACILTVDNLVYKNIQLEDDKFLSDYNIQNKAFIQMVSCNSDKFEIRIMNNEGKTFTLEMNINNTFKNLQTEIQDKYDIALRRQCFTCYGIIFYTLLKMLPRVLDERTEYNGNDNLEELYNDMKEYRKETQAVNKVLDNFLDSNSIDDEEHNFSALENLEVLEKFDDDDDDEVPTFEDSNSDGSSEEETSSEDRGDDSNPEENSDKEVLSDADEEYPITETPSQHADGEEEQTTDDLFFDDNNLPPYFNESNIKRNYKILSERHGKNDSEYLCVFLNDDRIMCYKYTYHKSRKGYICNNCISKKKIIVSAKIINNGNGDEYVKLGQNQHKCVPEKFCERTIIKLPEYQIFRDKYLCIFIGDEKCRKYTWLAKDKAFVCIACKGKDKEKYAYVAAYLIKKNGEEYIELSRKEHVCDPQPISKNFKRVP